MTWRRIAGIVLYCVLHLLVLFYISLQPFAQRDGFRVSMDLALKCLTRQWDGTLLNLSA